MVFVPVDMQVFSKIGTCGFAVLFPLSYIKMCCLTGFYDYMYQGFKSNSISDGGLESGLFISPGSDVLFLW